MNTANIDHIDAQLLDILQKDFPLTHRPFDDIASRLDINASEVMGRTTRLKTAGVIRQISAIFDSRALGYASALVTFKVDEPMLDSVAEDVSTHPGVSHCYSRDAEYNLWFTITLGPHEELTTEIESMAANPSVASYMILPAEKVYKIGVFFGMSGDAGGLEAPATHRYEANMNSLDPAQIKAGRALQKDLPIIDNPFSELAGQADTTEQSLLQHAEQFLKSGIMRRFAAVLRHKKAGYGANAMACWRVDPEQADRIGKLMAQHAAVSHCYKRPVSSEWPYALYTMIHARTDEQIIQFISELKACSELDDYKILRTVKEYKKTRVVYFRP